MAGDELASEFRAFWPKMKDRIAINAPGPLVLTLRDDTVPETGDVELPRSSKIGIAATLPEGAHGISIDCIVQTTFVQKKTKKTHYLMSFSGRFFVPEFKREAS